MDEEGQDMFKQLADGRTPDELIGFLREAKLSESIEQIKELSGLWAYLDRRNQKEVRKILYSEQEDYLLETSRGYGLDGKKPEDYIESFKEFIAENRNEIAALNILCTKPAELDRKSLKELKLKLYQYGYTEARLNTAWKASSNKEVVADIIAYIRTLSMGLPLVTPEERIKNAIQKVKALHPWNKIQTKWIERFEKQLQQETLLRKEDLDEEPFKTEGGYKRLNRIFDNQLDEVLETIRTNLLGA